MTSQFRRLPTEDFPVDIPASLLEILERISLLIGPPDDRGPQA